MKKTLLTLLGSSAALLVAYSANAADAIVAEAPVPPSGSYVQVCDAFGTGYFYIPGTETCLKIGGYVRFQTDFGRNQSGTSDWDSFTRAQLDLDARSETEYGALRGFIGLRGDADQGSSRGVNVDQAFIELGGLKVGFFYNWWDDGLSGETDVLSSHQTRTNAIRYTYTADAFYAGVAVEELEGIIHGTNTDNNVGIEAIVGASFGGVKANILGGYDTDAEEGAIRGILTAKLGPGTLGLSAIWASGQNAYYDNSEWTVAVEYALQATDKLKITPGFQYFDTIDSTAAAGFVGNRDAWKAGVTFDYQIATNLSAKASVQYYDADLQQETWTGFLRLQRAF